MEKQIQRAITIVTFFAVILFSLPLLAYTTENVFVVVIDGLRNNEAFEDADHDLIPHIWNDLRPQGTIYTEFYNDYLTTFTTPGHMAIVTGQWHVAPNLANVVSGGIYDVRPEAPTIFEYFRYHTGKPKASCLVVTGKKNNIQLDWSLEPTYGPNYASLLFEGGNDTDTYALLKTKLEAYHPNLVLVNLRDVDEAGHTGDWVTYTGAIKKADELVYQIWTQLIQGDAFYANKTTMIVTSDHGRHDDEYGGFQEHAGMCHGCRHVLFLGIGPDTPAGLEIPERRYLRDIAPTVGEFLGFPTPFARGQIMAGIFSQNPDPKIHVYCRNPRVKIFNGKVFVVWSQNDPTDTGNEHIFLMKKDSADMFFSNPIPVDSQKARWAFFPAVTANKDGLHVVWLDGRALDGIHDTWSVYYRKSPDYGSTWENEQLIATSTFESADPLSMEIVGEPEIISNELGELIITVRYKRGSGQNRRITSFRSADGGRNWVEIMVKQDNFSPIQYNPITMEGPKEASMVWIDLAPTPNKSNYYNWEVFFMRTMNSGTTWKDLNRLTNDAGYSYLPMLAWGGRKLITVWANREPSGTPWKLCVRSSTNKGWSWGSVLTIPLGSSSAWQPAIVWNSARSEFFMSWTDYASGVPDLRSSTSKNGVNWSMPVTINSQSTNIFRCKPHVTSGDGLLYLVWEEQVPGAGDWVIGTASL